MTLTFGIFCFKWRSHSWFGFRLKSNSKLLLLNDYQWFFSHLFCSFSKVHKLYSTQKLKKEPTLSKSYYIWLWIQSLPVCNCFVFHLISPFWPFLLHVLYAVLGCIMKMILRLRISSLQISTLLRGIVRVLTC